MDSFDDIWRNRFNAEETGNSEWNTPDERVWEGVASYIEAEKKRRRVLWLLFFAFLLLLSGILAGTNLFQNFMAKEIISDSQEQKVTYPKQVLSTVESVFSASANDEVRSQHPEVQQPVENPPIIRSLFSTSGEVKISTPELSDVLFKDGIDTEHLPERIQQNDQNTIVRDIPVSLSVVATLPTLQSSVDTDELSISWKKITPNHQKKRKWSVGLLGGATLLKHKISDQYNTDLSPFDFNYSDELGWHSGVQLTRSLNKWLSVYSGLRYEQLNSTSGHNSSLNYSTNAEEDEMYNVYALTLATPYGLSDAEFALNRDMDTEEEVGLLVDFKSTHQLRNFHLPLGVKIQPFGNSRRLYPSLQMGIGINYLNAIANHIKRIDTHHDAIHYEDSNQTNYAPPSFIDWHFDTHLGATLSYRISNDLDVNLGYLFNKGISPVFEQEKYYTKLDRHSLSLGISKKW